MLQVLCQILQTESLVDVQSWLVSASDSGILFLMNKSNTILGSNIIMGDFFQDKEKVKQLIDQAMRGLEESGRIDPSDARPSGNNTANATESSSTISEIENHLNR